MTVYDACRSKFILTGRKNSEEVKPANLFEVCRFLAGLTGFKSMVRNFGVSGMGSQRLPYFKF